MKPLSMRTLPSWSRPARGAWIEIGAAAPGRLAHATQNRRRPGLHLQSGASDIKGWHALPKGQIGSAQPPSRNGGRGTMKDRNKTSGIARFQMRGCVQHRTNCATRKATEPQFRGFLPHLCIFVVQCVLPRIAELLPPPHDVLPQVQRPGANTSGGGQSGRLSQF